jgi:hypothetical protein
VKTHKCISVIRLDGLSIDEIDCFTKFVNRKNVPVCIGPKPQILTMKDYVGFADFQRSKDGLLLQARIDWLENSPNYAELNGLWGRGCQLWSKLWTTRTYYKDSPTFFVDIERLELTERIGLFGGGIFDWQ